VRQNQKDVCEMYVHSAGEISEGPSSESRYLHSLYHKARRTGESDLMQARKSKNEKKAERGEKEIKGRVEKVTIGAKCLFLGKVLALSFLGW